MSAACTAEWARPRRQGKSDVLGATRIARQTPADPTLPAAFKRAGVDGRPDPVHEQILLWRTARRSLVKSRTLGAAAIGSVLAMWSRVGASRRERDVATVPAVADHDAAQLEGIERVGAADALAGKAAR